MSNGRRPLKKIILMTFLPVLLTVMVVAVPAFLMADEPAGAVTAGTQWDTLRGYVNSFFAGQYQYSPGTDGEAGFTIDRSSLKSRIDSNGDMSPNSTNITTTVTGVLGEGDDAATAPVLVDNYILNANVIPGTSVRCNWNGGYGVTTADNCFDSPKVTEIAGKVNAHAAAGFSTDIVVYCVSGRTESVTAGGMGTLAQTGALGDSDLNTAGDQAPKVLAYKWGRNGWNSTTTTANSTAGATGSVSAPSTTYGDGTGSASICSGAATDAELVRCTAQWAVYGTSTGGDTTNWLTPSATANGAGYIIGNGVTTLTSSNQVIDIRTPSPATTATVTGSPTTLKIPINTLFDTSVNFMDTRTTSTKNVFVGRTTHVAGMVAVNAVMLGYNSSFLAHGVNAWNTSLGGESYQTSGGMDTPAYPLQTATASNESAYLDTTAPGITTPSAASAITTSSADISRVANEPATMKVQYGTTSGVYTNTANNTVLNASKTVSLTGLNDGTTYYVKVTSYDGQANGTAETEFSFTTLDTTAPSITNLAPSGTIYTGSTTISADYSDGGSGINSSTAKIFLDGSATALTGCTATGTSISCPVTGLAYGSHTFSVEVKDSATTPNTATNTGGSFTVGDNVAPSVTYSAPTGNINTASPTITGTWSDPAPSSGINTASATVAIDAGTPTACTVTGNAISCPVTGLTDGAHSAVISISDNAANTGSNSPAGSFTVDTTAPSISNLAPSTTNYNGAPTISADYSDATSGINSSTAKIFLDGSATALTGCTPTGTGISCPTTGLAYGAHTFSVEVKDNANNTGTNTTGAFTVGDNVAPTVTYSAPTGTINTSSTTITGTYSDAAPSSGVDTTSATVSVDSGAPQACTASGGSISCPVSGLADGLRSAVISIKDNDNNTGSSTAGTFTVNTAAPTVTADNIGYQPGNWTNDTTPALSATITDVPGGENILGGSVTIDDVACTGTVAYSNTSVGCTPATALSAGSHTVVYSAYYSVGNNGVSPTQTINIDTTNPAVSNITPTGWTSNTGPVFEADLSDGSGSGINASSASISIDSGAALAGCTKTTTSISCPTSGLSAGSHTIDVSVNDNTGNTGTGSGSFSIDTTNPVVSNVTPTAWTESSGPTIEANLSDGSGSGINTSTATISLDGGPALTSCTTTTTHISCPSTGLADGNHTISVSVNDSVGNTGTGSGSFNVDTTNPLVGSVNPTGWVNDTGPTVSASLSDGSGSGISASSASISLDGGAALTGCTKTITSISCPTSGLAEGNHTISVSVIDNTGNTGSGSGSFGIDTTGPAITSLSPSGAVGSGNVTLSATLADTGGSGVNASSPRIYLDGSVTALTGCTATATSISCPATVGLGNHTFSVYAADSVGNETTNSSGAFTFTQRNYYFPWYDNNASWGMNSDVIHITNNSGSAANVDIYLGDIGDGDTPVADDLAVGANGQITWSSPTPVANGPVRVVSTTGAELTVSQRVIYKDSFTETFAVDGNSLRSQYYFSWYDNNPAWGMNSDVVHVTNLGSTAASVDIFVGGTQVASNIAIAPNANSAWQSGSLLTNGPVRVVDDNGNNLMVSQRVIYKDSFNETMGTPDNVLDNEAWFTWYDNGNAWGFGGDWICIANTGASTASVNIFVGGAQVAGPLSIAATGHVEWQSPVPLTNGPVVVTDTNNNNLLVSQRVVYKNSFEEIEPTYPAQMTHGANFNWYDNNAAWGMLSNRVHVANADISAGAFNIAIGGSTAGTLPSVASTGQGSWGASSPTASGPVNVIATGANKVVVSQRVIYKNSFSELVGRPIPSN